jgi:hypothetical protein
MTIQRNKACIRCGADEWYVRRKGNSSCAPCERKTALTRIKANPPDRTRKNFNNRTYKLRRQYGLSRAAYGVLLGKQEGCCAICVEPLKEAHVDHCHNTGVVRGLLCLNCNTGVGHFKESAQMLRKASDYVGDFGSNGLSP